MALTDEKPSLDYDQIEALSDAGRRLTGTRSETWVDDKSACTSCKYSQIIRRQGKNERSVFCNELNRFVPGDIVDCSSKSSFNQLSISQMAGIATLIGGLPERKVGFVKE